MKSNINFFTEDIHYAIKQKNLARKWINDRILSEGFSPGEINIIFCSDDYLHKINVEYLNHDNFTDIITFDYTENQKISGDLFISIERVKENAKFFTRKISEELHRVIIHGVLHLCGYGDKSKKEQEIMTKKENINLSHRPVKLRDS